MIPRKPVQSRGRTSLMSSEEFSLKLKIRKGYIKKCFQRHNDECQAAVIKKIIVYKKSPKSSLAGKILTFYIMYFYRFMKQTQQNLFLLKYRMAPSYNPEIIYLYVFRIQLTVLRNSYLVKIY